MPNRDFGGLIREHRQRLGLTPSRVAELIGRAPGTVRDWERGKTIPNDSRILSSLGAVLGVPEAELFEAAGMPLPATEHTMTIEESLATIAPKPGAATSEPETTEEQPSLFGEELEEAPGRRRHVREAPTRTQARAPAPAPMPIPAPRPVSPPASRSYVEDPDQRLAYRLRGLFTLIGLAVTFVVLVWAGANFLDALGGAWNDLFGGL